MNMNWGRLALAALLLGGAACQTTAVETVPVSQSLQPMQYQPLAAGDVIQWQGPGGKQEETQVVAVADGTQTLRDSDGCTWTQETAGFPPSIEWADCNTPDGTQQVRRTGNIFPLTVGATETWHWSGRNDRGQSWEGERVCTVTEQARVTVPAGTFDTYHVKCDDPWWVRHWYIAPELGRTVIFTRQHKRRAESERRELVAVKPAST